MGGGTINYSALVPWLHGKASNTYTQFGEDGLIAAVLDRVGTTCRHCFEIGAADGRFYSNTLMLRNDGWYAVLIESDTNQFDKLSAEFGNQSDCIHATCSDLDAALAMTNIDRRPDLGIIDIDGQDYWLWHDLQHYRPRVMLVEIATTGHWAPIPARGHRGSEQAGLDAIAELGRNKGYTLLATTVCNALFVDSSLLDEAC